MKKVSKTLSAFNTISEYLDVPMEDIIDYFSIISEVIWAKDNSTARTFDEFAEALKSNVVISDISDQIKFNRENNQ